VSGTPAVAIEVLRERMPDPGVFIEEPLLSIVEADNEHAFQHRIKSNGRRVARNSCNVMQPMAVRLHSENAVVGIGQFSLKHSSISEILNGS
jgi:hypothetical protein